MPRVCIWDISLTAMLSFQAINSILTWKLSKSAISDRKETEGFVPSKE